MSGALSIKSDVADIGGAIVPSELVSQDTLPVTAAKATENKQGKYCQVNMPSKCLQSTLRPMPSPTTTSICFFVLFVHIFYFKGYLFLLWDCQVSVPSSCHVITQ